MNNRWDRLGLELFAFTRSIKLGVSAAFLPSNDTLFRTLHRHFHFVRPSMMFARESRLYALTSSAHQAKHIRASCS